MLTAVSRGDRMEIFNVLVAAAASYAFGAIWYMALAKPWMAAAGIAVGADGKPANSGNPVPYIIAFVSAVLVAGMMRHVFAMAGLTTVIDGLMGGFGLGLFIATPWLATTYGFGGRPVRLLLIDGGYATLGCTIMGLVLVLF